MIYSAGIIPFRFNAEINELEFFLGHPGGHGWETKNYWAFLKGQVQDGETWVDAALREFKEESGLVMEDCDTGMLIPLGSVQQNPMKIVIAYGLHYPNIDPSKCVSNLADDGVTQEVDKYSWIPFSRLKSVTHRTHIRFYEALNDMYFRNDSDN